MQSNGWRERIGKTLLGAGELSSTPPGVGPREPAMGHTHIRQPPAAAPGPFDALSPRDLLAGLPGGTGAVSLVAESIETVICGALVVGRGAEPAVAGWRLIGAYYSSVRALISPDPVRLQA